MQVEEQPQQAPMSFEDGLDYLSNWASESGLEADLCIASNKYFLRYFLKNKGGNVEAAQQMVTNYLNWRKENNIGDLDFNAVRQQLEMGKICVLPNPGHPTCDLLVIFVSRLHYPKDFPTLTFLRSLIFLFEYFMCKEEEHTGFMILNDMQGVRKANFDFKVSQVVRSLQACIPMLPQKIVIYKPPFIFKLVWKVIHPFLTPAIINLIEVVHDDEGLRKYVNQENLITEYGGTINADRLKWLENLPGFEARFEEVFEHGPPVEQAEQAF